MAHRAAACAEIVDAGPDAPWLVMVHGNSQNREAFSGVLSAYRDSYRLLVADLPGHGESAAIPGPYGPVEHALAVDAAMRAAGVENAHFWGTHTGASVGLVLAARAPARFASLVLEGAVIPGENPPSVTAALALAHRTAHEQGLEAARVEWFERSPWFRVMRENPVSCRAAEHAAMIAAFGCGPWTDASTPQALSLDDEALARIDVPVLLVSGEHEVPDFLDAVERLARVLPRARRALIAGGGGFPLWEVPQAVNQVVAPFLERAAA